MQLLDAWQESLKFFERKNVTFVGLVTLKAIKYTYEHIVKYLGIFIIFVVAMTMFVEPRLPAQWAMLWHAFAWTARIIFLVFMYLTVRSSVMKKDWSYYRFFLAQGAMVAMRLGVLFSVFGFIGYQWWNALSLFITFEVLFYLDAGKKNMLKFYGKQALTMIIYNLPICIVIGIALSALWYIYMTLIQLIRIVIPVPIGDASFLFMPIEACLLVNLYIKWLHEQFSLYYKQKTKKDVNV